MSASNTARERIRQSSFFICVLPADWEGAEGRRMFEELCWAIELEKQIFVWRVPARKDTKLPRVLDDYAAQMVVDGDVEDVVAAIKKHVAQEGQDG